MAVKQGLFVVIEGVNGAGKTTNLAAGCSVNRSGLSYSHYHFQNDH